MSVSVKSIPDPGPLSRAGTPGGGGTPCDQRVRRVCGLCWKQDGEVCPLLRMRGDGLVGDGDASSMATDQREGMESAQQPHKKLENDGNNVNASV